MLPIFARNMTSDCVCMPAEGREDENCGFGFLFILFRNSKVPSPPRTIPRRDDLRSSILARSEEECAFMAFSYGNFRSMRFIMLFGLFRIYDKGRAHKKFRLWLDIIYPTTLRPQMGGKCKKKSLRNHKEHPQEDCIKLFELSLISTPILKIFSSGLHPLPPSLWTTMRKRFSRIFISAPFFF